MKTDTEKNPPTEASETATTESLKQAFGLLTIADVWPSAPKDWDGDCDEDESREDDREVEEGNCEDLDDEETLRRAWDDEPDDEVSGRDDGGQDDSDRNDDEPDDDEPWWWREKDDEED